MRPFLNSTILFSSISPEFKVHLWDELTSCEKFVGIPYDILMTMPTYIRKFHIQKHNDYISEENERSRNEMNTRKNKSRKK